MAVAAGEFGFDIKYRRALLRTVDAIYPDGNLTSDNILTSMETNPSNLFLEIKKQLLPLIYVVKMAVPMLFLKPLSERMITIVKGHLGRLFFGCVKAQMIYSYLLPIIVCAVIVKTLMNQYVISSEKLKKSFERRRKAVPMECSREVDRGLTRVEQEMHKVKKDALDTDNKELLEKLGHLYKIEDFSLEKQQMYANRVFLERKPTLIGPLKTELLKTAKYVDIRSQIKRDEEHYLAHRTMDRVCATVKDIGAYFFSMGALWLVVSSFERILIGKHIFSPTLATIMNNPVSYIAYVFFKISSSPVNIVKVWQYSGENDFLQKGAVAVNMVASMFIFTLFVDQTDQLVLKFKG